MQLPEQIESERIILKHPINSPEDEFTGFIIGVYQKNWKEGSGVTYLIYQKETNQILGIVDLFQINEKNQSAEIGFWLSDSATGHGYMQEAVQALEKLLLN